MKYTYSEIITGVVNSTVYGSGITSTDVEKKKLNSVVIVTSAKAGNFIEGWYERERTHVIADNVLPLVTDGYRIKIDVDEVIEQGKTWKAALRCGGTATNITVMYEYEVVS